MASVTTGMQPLQQPEPQLHRRLWNSAHGSSVDAAVACDPSNIDDSDRVSTGDPSRAKQARASSYGVSLLVDFDRADRLTALALTIVCLFTRLYQIGRRDMVSWDEFFHGRFSSYYLNRTFYHDVHPPTAKLLIGLSAWIAGHNGSFSYESGTQYPSHVNYVFQRSFVAVVGAMVVPLAYRTCRYLKFSRAFAFVAASFVLFDNALCVMSRFILLDPLLLCFTAMSLLGHAAFTAHQNQPFSLAWWRWLAFTGVSLALAASSKWAGLFTVALVGIFTFQQLVALFYEAPARSVLQLRHWSARALCLIAIPAVLYIASFKAHFSILSHRGTGDYKMPSTFQALQRYSVVSQQPHDVAFGSQITLRSHLPGFGLIYVNETFRFLDGDQECIAAGIGGKQKFNWWNIVSASSTRENTTSPVKHIQDGEMVRFVHEGTGRYLRTGAHRPHHLDWDRRMFADGNETSLSLLDLWRVQIADEASPMPKGQLYAVTTSFRLFNMVTGCLLLATNEQLPQWGRRMSELICTDATAMRSEGTLWNIEQVRDSRFKRANFRHLVKRRLLRDTIWLNREMALTNSRLIADPDYYKHTESGPASWPFLLYPMRLVSWSDDSVKYYEIGNPLLWWSSTLCCLIYPLQLLYWLLCWQRGCLSWRDGELGDHIESSLVLWVGWAIHYFPFFLMGRVTYIHHYLPALYFALLLLAFEIQCAVRWYLPRVLAWPAAASAVAVAGVVFYMFSPLTFGWDRPAEELAHLCWLPTWNLCNDSNAM